MTEARSNNAIKPSFQSNLQLNLPFERGADRKNQSRSNSTCIYCGDAAETRDHVPPKALLVQPFPLNLRTVPACATCNTSWSLDEQYLAIALAHLTYNPRLQAELVAGGLIDRALAAAPTLDDRIASSMSVQGGRVFFAPELARMQRIAEKIAHGLHCLKYGMGPRLQDFQALRIFGPGEEIPQSLAAAMWNWPGLRRKRWTVVQKDIFSFLFTKGWMVGDPPLYCLIDLAGTLLMTVACPSPIGRPAIKRLRSKPWS